MGFTISQEGRDSISISGELIANASIVMKSMTLSSLVETVADTTLSLIFGVLAVKHLGKIMKH